MPVEYPIVIAAIKDWIGGHKTMPSPSIEIDGQPAMKKASFADMFKMAFQELTVAAITAGVELTTGGTEAFNKYFDSLPTALKEPLTALKDTVTNIVDAAPGGGIISDGLTAFKEAFINPIGDALSEFKAGFSNIRTDLEALRSVAPDSDFAQEFSLAKAAYETGGVIGKAIDSVKSWSDGLTLGTGDYTLSQAFSDVNNSSTKFLETYVGITKTPPLTELVGTIAEKKYITDLSNKIAGEQTARSELTIALAGVDPLITSEESLTDEQKAALNNWRTAHNQLLQATLAINHRTNSGWQDENGNYVAEEDVPAEIPTGWTWISGDKENVTTMLASQSAVSGIGQLATQYNSVTDPEQRALLESTIKPSYLDATQKIAPIVAVSVTPAPPDIIISDQVKGKTPGVYDA